MSAYYNENKHRFLHKAVGLAAVGGLVTLALTRGAKPIGALLDRVATSEAAQGFAGILFSGARGALQSEEAFAGTYLSNEVRGIKEMADILDVGITSHVQSQKRLDAFMANIQPFFEDKDHKWDTPTFQRSVRKHLAGVGMADRASDLPNGFLSHEGIMAFNKHLEDQGVRSTFRNHNVQIDHFKSIVNGINHQSSAQDVAKYLGNTNNSDQIFRMLEEVRTFHAQREGALRSRFTPKTRNILLGELAEGHRTFDQRAYDAVIAELSHRHSVDAQQAETILRSTLQSHLSSVVKLFPGGSHLVAAKDMMLSAHSGFVLDEARNKARSLTRLARAGSGFVQKALQNIQLPLTPYRFNIPLKFVDMIPKAQGLAQQLGMMSTQPELLRMANSGRLGGASAWTDPTTHLIAAGDRIMAISDDGLHLAQGKFLITDLKKSPLMRRMAGLRSLQEGKYQDTLLDFKQGGGHKTKLQKTLQGYAHTFSEVDLDAEHHQFVVRPKHWATAPLVKMMGFPSHGVDPQTLHPHSIVELLGRMDPSVVGGEDYNRVMGTILHEAGKINTNHQDFFRRFAWNLPDDFHIPGLGKGGTNKPGDFAEVMVALMRGTGSVEDTMSILQRPLSRLGGQSVLDSPGQLRSHVSYDLYRALTAIRTAPDSLGAVSRSDAGGLIGAVRQQFGGNTGESALGIKLQQGLFSQILHGLGVGQYGGYEELAGHLESVAGTVFGATDWNEALEKEIGNSQFLRDFQKLGGGQSVENMYKMLSYVVHDHRQGPSATYSRMGEVASLLLKKNQVLGLSEDNVVRAKLVNSVRGTLEDTAYLDIHTKNHVLRNLMINEEQGGQEEWLLDTVRRRFHPLRGAHGQEFGANPLFNSRYYALPNNKPSAAELLLNPIQAIREVYENSARAGNFLASLSDPTKAHGPISALAHMITLMPQGVGENAGLGLPLADQLSPLRATIGWWAKRVLPLTAGVELYKNINHQAHDFNAPGLDDIAANFVANANLAAAGVKDFFGITSMAKHLVAALPGIDQYFHPRSHDEYKDYLMYGEEEVREGRGWFIGSRSNLAGGRIKYVRPNFYRRWHSHWTEAENVDISNSEHSFLPSLSHPLAPIKRFITDRDWFVHKHLADRPYATGGVGVGNPYNPDGNFLTTNNQDAYGLDGAYGVGGSRGGNGTNGSVADLGGGYPTTLLGGGIPLDLVHGVGGVSSGYGKGRVGDSDPIRIELHERMKPASVFSGIGNSIAGRVQNIRSQAGLFGAVMNKLPGFPAPHGLMPQNYRAAISNTRLLFGGEYGELTMSLGEFYRRIIHPEDLGDYNPLPNNQASWMPERFRTGDPYIKNPGGYFNVPGEAYEKLNPWIAPLRVRGSAIGLTMEEIIQKWINPTEPLGGGNDGEDIVEFGCVDTETEILTDQGWCTLSDIQVGTMILTLNHETGFSEWQPIEHINSYYVHNKPLVSLEGNYHSSLTTPNHKWPIIHHYQKHTQVLKNGQHNFIERRDEREWTTSNLIGQRNSSIILAAKLGSIPLIPSYTDEFVELVAWFWTEGTINNNHSIHLYQSKTINPIFVERIRHALTTWLGPESTDMKTLRGSNPPMWRELHSHQECADFSLNVQASQLILNVAPNKIVSIDFIKSLTESQLRLFVEVSLLAAGKNDRQIDQKHKSRLTAIELACIFLGKRTNIGEYKTIYKYKDEEREVSEHVLGMYDEQLLRFNHFKGRSMVRYTGKVWCPTVKNKTWCARRKGKVFFTGNSEAHIQIQRKLNERGMLLSAETSIYDKEHNISGTIDAIIRGQSGPEIVDIKTQGASHWGETPSKYVDQITAYMAITGIHRAHLAFVNRDDPTITRMESFDFDARRWQSIINKVDSARSVVTKMVDAGTISPFQTYDLLSRIDVLSKIAPSSPEFQSLVDYAQESGGFGGFEKQRFEQALDRAHRLQEQYRLYPRQSIMTESHLVRVQGIGGGGEILTEGGALRLAGVEFNQQAFGQHSAEDLLAEYGIHVGSIVRARVLRGTWDPDIRNDTLTPAIIGHTNRRLMASPWASEKRDTHNPLDNKAVGDEVPFLTRAWEWWTHHDGLLQNKLLRTRTAVEQLERGEIYGTDNFSWGDITNTLVTPTIASVASKNPLAAMLKGALIAGLFFGDRQNKIKAMAIGGIAGGAISTARAVDEIIMGRPWKRKAVKKQEAFDEYWDTLEYTKFATMAEAAKKKARRQEGVNVDKLESGANREYGVSLGPWATLAVYAERKARRTMRGYDAATGTLQEALSTLPLRHKQLAESVITTGSIREKRRFYDLISNPEKRVLAKFLSRDWESAPKAPELHAYFRRHYLPGHDWAGYQENVDLDALRTRAADAGGMKVERPTRGQVERAAASTPSVNIPKFKKRTPSRIRRTLDSLMSHGNFSTVKAKYVIRPSTKSMVNVDFNLFQDQTQELIAEARDQMYMGEQNQ